MLFTVYYLLSTVYYLLYTVYCLYAYFLRMSRHRPTKVKRPLKISSS